MLAMSAEQRGGADQAGDETPTASMAWRPGRCCPAMTRRTEEHETSGRMNLLHRLTDPAELADAALFLADGWLASGETLFVDSGQHLLSQPRDVLYLARA